MTANDRLTDSNVGHGSEGPSGHAGGGSLTGPTRQKHDRQNFTSQTRCPLMFSVCRLGSLRPLR